ncbi:unconventional myosin-VIIb-like [Genypterus blacodes]|uniref:unconventional myosin-VIIb-like n=1 Tax=Genypterus blacodes TaxID=154954 RepID=UPI003F77091C
MLRKGEWVWVDTAIGVPIGARVKVTASGHRLLLDDEGKEYILSQEQEASLRVMHPTSVEGVDDMIQLGDLTEAGLLRNLRLRHKQGNIYTYTGSVLVAVNPYKEYPIYSAEQVQLYHGRKLGELPPHIFAIADTCYYNMTRYHRDQCCIISGESGAGKTESTKLLLKYLAAVSGQLSEQQIEQQILESNPILEAFGNAKTIHNNNSSRFGKYLEIFFNKDGVIEGAHVEQYLLEKSRVCHQAQEERNYHMFYCMLSGVTAKEKKQLNLGDANEYNFLTKGDCIKCEGCNDAESYKRICSALKILNFPENQWQEILKLLAAILHMGNVCFQATMLDNMESSGVTKSEHFSFAASLLQVQSSSLATSLTHRSFLTNRERVTKPLSSEQASDCRDAFLKAIYNKLFIWIVGKINSVIHQKLANNPKSSFQSIGLLDIFGFENFNTNSFEQLCINFANEKLQQFFVGHIFKQEQAEYLKEDIVWNNITFDDNRNILDLLAGKPCNLLALIDEESHFPKGSDITLLSKMNQQHKANNIYVDSRSERNTFFGICHFAGMVSYETKGFLEKNRDALSPDIIKMVDTSTNKLLRQIFESDLSTNVLKVTGNSRIILTPKSTLRAQSETRKQVPTLSGQFRKSLDSLMKALSACQPFFIRCFKPNNEKQSEVFDRELCMRQLSYSGMMDTIRIRKLGFPIRHSFEEFLKRYRVLLRTTVCDPNTETAAACCDAICKAMIMADDKWKMGRTKIFLKDVHDAVLERVREEELSRTARVIQRVMLAIKDRKSFVSKRRAAVVLQKHWRAHREKIYQRKVRHGFDRLASRIRARQLQFQYNKKREAAITIQKQMRGYQARKTWKQRRDAAILLQAQIRGLQARRLAVRRRADVKPLPIPQQSSISDQTDEAQDNNALGQQLVLALANLQQNTEEPEPITEEPEPITEEPEPITEQCLVDNFFDFLPAPASPVEEPQASPPEDFQRRRTLQPVEETASEDSEPESPASVLTSTTSPVLPEEEYFEYDDSKDEYAFGQYHFQGNATHTHITQRLTQPLLQHEDEGDTLACLTVWWMILRFMEDVSEPKTSSRQSISLASSPINRYLAQKQGRRLSNLVGLDQKILRKNKKKFGGGNRRASTIPEEPEEFPEDDDDDILIGEGPTLDRPLSSLEKLHIIVGYALSRPDIRDEVYCQICKQLVNNKNKSSRQQGWILLSICLGVFPPSKDYMKYLESFLRRGPDGYGAYCTERLRRIKANGERKEPPCWIELQAARSREPIDISVTLTDGQTISLPMDSASTSAEICQAMADKIHLKDIYGFSLYIKLHEKLWSLGSSGRHVMDAVSQCEQEMRRQGKQEQDARWKFSISKELFTPWHDCSKDPVSTDLIYKQVIKGIKSGDYTCEKEDEYVQLAAKHYYIQFGSEHSTENAHKVVKECINTSLIENKSLSKWVQLITDAHLQGPYINGKKSADSVKGELVDCARETWPIYFSKFYEVTMTSGPALPKSRFIVAVNWNGILFMDGKDVTLVEFPFLEVKDVQLMSDVRSNGLSVSLGTVRGDYTLKCVDAADLAAFIERNIQGLKERSVYAMARQDINKPDDPMFLVCKRGDLLVVVKDEEYTPDQNFIKATNERTCILGSVYSDSVEFLPTLSRPSDMAMDLLSPHKGIPSSTQSAPKREEALATVSLKEFSMEHFRQPSKDGGRHGARGATRERLWACGRETLKQPLLQSLVRNSDLNYLACNAFTDILLTDIHTSLLNFIPTLSCLLPILKYMGDYPIKHVRSPVELTDQIFGPATQHEALQDEIYCQIMRQLTSNNNRLSMERGWQLMWLCSGLFTPSPTLLRHTQRFLETRRRDPLTVGCLVRLQAMSSMQPRKLPPHLVEVDAIQQNSMQIFHKIHFPNDTNDIFEVTSTTRIIDLCCIIADQMNLSSAEGYGLYLKTPNKVQSLDDEQYLFDSLRENSDNPKKVKKGKEGVLTSLPYLVIFKRKLWFNVSPGKHLVADLAFHFPQELPKYLRGYHNCTREDMINVGGLLFRIKVDSDRSQFVMIPRMLKDLVPADKIKLMLPEEWKKHIISSYNKQSGTTVDEAKVAFLRSISSWPTFGCTFFEVKQTCERSYPGAVLIAVSKLGVSLINPITKELLVMHKFNRITGTHSGNNFFEMTIGNLERGNIFSCETLQGETMVDLLRSYIRMYERQRQDIRPRNHMFS